MLVNFGHYPQTEIERLIRWSRLKIPEVPKGDQLGLILVMRLTPGIPLFFRNYVLGFVRAPFWLYLPLSVLINGIHACGIVLVGAGASDGRLLPVASGVGLVVAAVIVTRWLRARVVKRREERQSS